MILTNETRNSIIAKLFKIMRMTTKYDYIPDERLKKQLLLKEQTCLEKSRTVNEYIDKINYIIHSINNDCGIISPPIRYNDLTPRNIFDRNYTKHSDLHINNYDIDHTIKNNNNNVGVSSSFHRIYDIYTMTNNNIQQQPNQYINHQNKDNNMYNKQIKNNLKQKMPRMQYFPQPYNETINVYQNTFNEDIHLKKKIGLQEAKDSVVDLLRESIETKNVETNESILINKKAENDNGFFSKYIDSNSLNEFINYIKREGHSKGRDYLSAIDTFSTKLLDSSYKIRLLLIETGNQRDFIDYKKIRDIFEYQIKHKEIIFIDSFFLSKAEDFVNKIANKSRKNWFIDNPKGGTLDYNYDLFINNLLTK